MDLVLLIGGFGTRLRPLTYVQPKPLLRIVDKSLLDQILTNLPSDVSRVILTIGYKADSIRSHISAMNYPFEIKIVEEDKPLGTGGAINNLAPMIDSTFFAMNGDLLTSLDMGSLLSTHKKGGGLGTIATWTVDDPSRFGVLDTTDEGRVTSFLEKPAPHETNSRQINAGMYCLEPEALKLSPKSEAFSIERDLFPKLTEPGLYSHAFDGYWIDVGTPESYLKGQKLVMKHHWDELQKQANANLQAATSGDEVNLTHPFWVGKGASIASRVSLKDHTVIGDNCVIEEGVQISGSVIGSSSYIGKKASLKRSATAIKTMIDDNDSVMDRFLANPKDIPKE